MNFGRVHLDEISSEMKGPAKIFRRHKRTFAYQDPVADIVLSSDFSDDGFFFVPFEEKEKYLSYEAPVGSWSKQLQAFENAVIISKMLNRTLLAKPLASELEIKRLSQVVKRTFQPHSKVYDILDTKFTVPVSSILDLNHLSKLIRVQSVPHQQFINNFENLSRFDVCHRDSVGFWVDFVPAATNKNAWKVLEAQNFAPLSFSISAVDPACDFGLEVKSDSHQPKPVIRGILSELSRVKEDLLYFRAGSMATTEIRFLSKRRTALAQEWTDNYIRFTRYVQEKFLRIMAKIKQPYNAMMISRNEEGNLNNTIYYRLRQMEKMKFRNITNVLYIITHVNNLTHFEPLRTLGYEMYLSRDLVPSGISSFLRHDVIELFGLVICKYARLYAGSTEPYLIRRGRIHEAERKDGLLVDHVTVKWAGHTVKRRHRILPPRNVTSYGQLNLRTHKPNYISCTVCKFMHNTLRHKICVPIMSECSKLRLI
ncbi:hypothetical protein AWC38_SpisGene2987 [Stylophora pistillata]|uniref:Uncharacterized protein n=1 Tax=Stylophora pistillata TaxID=50429 RepID=A0A2B4SUW8_STYPI|nr:hypothetical protein AWC38_SpisGene2987 [Stylophora pistillata]